VDPDTAEADKAVPYKIIAKYRRVDPAVSLFILPIRVIADEARRFLAKIHADLWSECCAAGREVRCLRW
jgi:hypothetical protein